MKPEVIKVGMFLRYTKGEQSMVGTAVLGLKGELLFEWGPKACLVSQLTEKGWTATLLVPAEEVREAWKESQESVGCFGECDAITNGCQWNDSRAKRIAEGLE